MMIKTINQEFQGEYKSLNSKFITYFMPFRNKSELNDIISRLKKEHPKARHVCYAYRLGYQNEEYRANDDGEPSGTAGKPILNQLYSFEVQNCILLVVRYFGGTKLGVPGLIEAYKEAAIDALNKSTFVDEEEKKTHRLLLNPMVYYSFLKQAKNESILIIDSQYENEQYVLEIQVPLSKEDAIRDYLEK